MIRKRITERHTDKQTEKLYQLRSVLRNAR